MEAIQIPLKGLCSPCQEAEITRKYLSKRVDREVRFLNRELAKVEGVTQSLNVVLEGHSSYRGKSLYEKSEDTWKGNFLLRGLSTKEFESSLVEQ